MSVSVLVGEPERLERGVEYPPWSSSFGVDKGNDNDNPAGALSDPTKSAPSPLATFLCSLIHLTCMPWPRWAPTPAFKSSVLFRTRHTRRGHGGLSGRIGLP